MCNPIESDILLVEFDLFPAGYGEDYHCLLRRDTGPVGGALKTGVRGHFYMIIKLRRHHCAGGLREYVFKLVELGLAPMRLNN